MMMFLRGLQSVAIGLGLSFWAVNANANPTLVVDVETGAVLYHQMGTAPWFPASLTKLMTTYVALSKVREGKLSLDTPLRVSTYAASMAPSKMGFRPGTLVTLDNALKMLMVKSPNDIAVTIAEGISGSVPSFAAEMNAYGAKLGLHESHFDNPNGLPDEQHISSARDMAMIGRALFREFPEDHDLFGIPALSFGGRIINNHNSLIGRYPGIDGMKTGYTCSAGYNVVASAQRGNKHLIVVILGAPSGRERSERAAGLFEKYFPDPSASQGDLAALPASDIVLPPDLRGQICGPGRRNAIAEAEAEDSEMVPPPAPAQSAGFGRPSDREQSLNITGAAAAGAVGVATPGGRIELLGPRAAFQPVKVFIGPVAGWTGTVAGPVEAGAPGPSAKIAVAIRPDVSPEASTPPGEALATPLALAGATAPAAALVAANKAVKTKGHMSMHVSRKTSVQPTPAKVAAATKAMAIKTSLKSKAKAKPAAKPSKLKKAKAASE